LPLLCIVFANKKMGMVGDEPCSDVKKYIGWASPVIVPADDVERLRSLIHVPDTLTVLVITGECPVGETHETVEC
ncbi:MAG TPA: indolepyruvate ferredoxin oxidoreductase, partial [Methanomicrobiales archaeon]|nr:indolepyruvate ferredoxin oxidoreductase [Methanomicrobiales archaeon]